MHTAGKSTSIHCIILTLVCSCSLYDCYIKLHWLEPFEFSRLQLRDHGSETENNAWIYETASKKSRMITNQEELNKQDRLTLCTMTISDRLSSNEWKSFVFSLNSQPAEGDSSNELADSMQEAEPTPPVAVSVRLIIVMLSAVPTQFVIFFR